MVNTLKTQCRASAWERVFGGDLWILRNIMRRFVSVFMALIPFKAWRHQARENLDRWIIACNAGKIAHFVEQYPPVKSELETVASLVKNGASIGRFGDGEFNMCIGRHKSFQTYDSTLVARLKEVLHSTDENFLVGINTIQAEHDLTEIWKKFVVRRGNRVLKLLDHNRLYDSSTITTVFPQQSTSFEDYITALKLIWHNRKVVFVVGRNSRFFFEKELFDNLRCHEFVYGPAKDAFSVYDELMKQVMVYDKDWLILIALGPTATVMAYDLYRTGYQAIDLGQTPSKYHKAKYGSLYPADHPLFELNPL
ncbi:hypothetical protein Dace_1624 [Desulfuromonas acetoxidans DSM 684]|uniref:Glycosyltransferase GT-D fold domain-containing protein n=1 Tax=Desulfuromonas acetoxidans (strain DSM 684 / 11070) TaxID=281689 RepID=Q1K148_DESA6|nr:hypothetical protein Dace_1624 [Desulfuromonas acetoxidans DSM 684]